MVHAIIHSPVGELTIVGEVDAVAGRTGPGARFAPGEAPNVDLPALTGVYFAEHVRRPARELFGPRADNAFPEAVRQLAEYFAGDRTTFELVLRPKGNDFQRKVWSQLIRIPYGEVRSYRQLAAVMGGAGLARAVGAANGQNPLSIIVPCHRVVGSDGRLTGYAGGLERKAFLLELETPAADRVPSLF